jgi:hypothetical protein
VSSPAERPGEARFETPVGGDAGVVLYAERLRDNRLALGTRGRGSDGEWRAGELHVLERGEYLALAAWLAGVVEEQWHDTIRDRQADQVNIAHDLYGEGPDALVRLALDVVREMPPALLLRALVLLVNSIGPEAHQRLIARLNRTAEFSEDAALRRRIAEEREAFAYAIAAAALFDAIERGEEE